MIELLLEVQFYTQYHQAGLTSKESRHIYSNPFDPTICPIWAWASYLISFLAVLRSKNGLLFPGSYQKKRFGQSLHSVLRRHYDEYQALGASPKDLGTHIVRKGTATYCFYGVHPDPPIVSVCLRAGWTVVLMKERYLKYESVGDQLVGRSLKGINPQSEEFSTSPCFIHSLHQEMRERGEQLAKYCFPSQNQQFTHTGVFAMSSGWKVTLRKKDCF